MQYVLRNWCNALLYRLPLKQTQRLQKIQNWAARLIDGAMRYSHATPLLKKLHCLPIAVRVEFKIMLLTHRALNGQAPDYIGHCEADASRLGRCAPANSVYCVCHAQGVTGVTGLSAWQPQAYGTHYRII